MNRFGYLRESLPIVRLSPASTFRNRLFIKIRTLFKYKVLPFFGFSGAKPMGLLSNGNSLLKLNRDSFLGIKGDLLQLPRDRANYNYIKGDGSYETEQVLFLSSLLSDLQQSGVKVLFLDLGANVGLISRQVWNLCEQKPQIMCVEPIPQHLEALEWNLRELAGKKLTICNYGLGPRTETREINLDLDNFAASSLITDFLSGDRKQAVQVEIKSVAEFAKLLDGYDKFVIKIDIEGYDALVLNSLPEEVWERVEGVCIELLNLPEIEEGEKRLLILNLKRFTYLSWAKTPKNFISIEELSNFLLSTDEIGRDLLCRM